MTEKFFDIEGMTCSACQSHIQNAVEKLSGIISVNVNLLSNSMTVCFNEKILSEKNIEQCVKKAGYKATPKNKSKPNSTKAMPHKLILSIILLLCLMYFSMGNMMWNWPAPGFIDHHTSPIGFALIQLILVIPIITLNFHYFISGYKKLFNGKPNMDSLIAIGSTMSMAYGLFAMFIMFYGSLTENQSLISAYHDCLYFESAGMILTLVSVGKYLEGISKKKTTSAIEKLMDLSPKTATILTPEGEQSVASQDIDVGDIVIVKKGESIAIDGEIVEGTASIDESNITGESIPVTKSVGAMVFSSTIITSGYLKIKATRVGSDTSISVIAKLVEEASNSKAPISKLADKISGIFVPIIFVISALTFIINLAVSKNFELALNFAITVTVIACPCALGLATPVAIMVGTGKGSECGLLIKNAEIMEKTHLVNTIVLDKTGTITEGNPVVTNFDNFENDSSLLSVIHSIEKLSEHPLAKAITEFAISNNAKELKITNYSSKNGFGLTGNYNNHTYFIGNYKYAETIGVTNTKVKTMLEAYSAEGKTSLLIIKDSEICGIIAVKDNVKPESKQAITELKKIGIKTIMLTGDNKTTAEIIAKQVGIDKVISEVRPEEKQQVVASLKSSGNRFVAMVGDGVNDALALTSADLGISIGSGSDIAIETSDIVLKRNNLLDILNIIRLSKRVLSTIKLGLFWAFFYNIVCVLIATGVFYYPFGLKINPMIGSLAMSISSVSVVLNALTINLFKPVQNKKQKKEKTNMKTTYKYEFYVKGMMCNNCKNHITSALEKNKVKDIEIDLETKKVKVSTTLTKEKVFKIIENVGYTATDD